MRHTIALLMPVLNESSDVQITLDSIFASTRLPDEIVIADGGSTDDTLAWIERYKDRGIPLKITHNPKIYAGAGRNAAAALTSCDLLLCVDFGNRLDRHWIAEMAAPFEQDPSIEFTAGTAVPLINSDFEYCVAAIHYHLNQLLGKIPVIELLSGESTVTSSTVNKLPEALTRHGLAKKIPAKLEPGGLGLAVRRSCWEKLGGMPAWLRASEDHLFGQKLMAMQAKYQTCAGARLYHHMRSSPKDLFKQMFIYARGNGQTHHKRPLVIKTACVYLAIFACFLLPIPLLMNIVFALVLLGIYVYHQGIRKIRITAGKNFQWQYVPLAFGVLLPRDAGMIAGYCKGCYDWWTDPQYPVNYASYLKETPAPYQSDN